MSEITVTPQWSSYERAVEKILTSGEPVGTTLESLESGYVVQRANLYEAEIRLARASGLEVLEREAPATLSDWLKQKRLKLSDPARQMILEAAMRDTMRQKAN